MIDLKKEVGEYVGDCPAFDIEVQKDFDRFNPADKKELDLFYKFTTSYLKANVKHEVPKEIEVFDGRVLDFGAGAGNVSVFLAESGVDVEYLDINYPQMDFLRWLKKKHHLPKLNIVFYPSGKYDYMVLRDIVEHLEDYPVELISLFKHLRKNGSIFIKPEFASGQRSDGKQYVHFTDKYDFNWFMRDQGFVKQSEHVWKKEGGKE